MLMMALCQPLADAMPQQPTSSSKPAAPGAPPSASAENARPRADHTPNTAPRPASASTDNKRQWEEYVDELEESIKTGRRSTPTTAPSSANHSNTSARPNLQKPAPRSQQQQGDTSARRDSGYESEGEGGQEEQPQASDKPAGDEVRADEVRQMSISQLKARLEALGVDYSKCVEKGELVQLLIESLARPRAAGPQPTPNRPTGAENGNGGGAGAHSAGPRASSSSSYQQEPQGDRFGFGFETPRQPRPPQPEHASAHTHRPQQGPDSSRARSEQPQAPPRYSQSEPRPPPPPNAGGQTPRGPGSRSTDDFSERLRNLEEDIRVWRHMVPGVSFSLLDLRSQHLRARVQLCFKSIRTTCGGDCAHTLSRRQSSASARSVRRTGRDTTKTIPGQSRAGSVARHPILGMTRSIGCLRGSSPRMGRACGSDAPFCVFACPRDSIRSAVSICQNDAQRISRWCPRFCLRCSY